MLLVVPTLCSACASTPPLSRAAVAPSVAFGAGPCSRPFTLAGASVPALLLHPALVHAEVVANPYAKAEAANAALRSSREAAGPGFFDSLFSNAANLALTGVVLALVGFIASFALEAVKEVGDTSRNLADAIQDNYGDEEVDDSVKQQGGFLFVDDNPNSRKSMGDQRKGTRATTSIKDRKKKIDFTKSETGFDFAPWMKIDQNAVAAAEAARKARKKAGK